MATKVFSTDLRDNPRRPPCPRPRGVPRHGRVLRRPAIVPVPAFALRLLLGEFATVLLAGARVIPERAAREGFRFRDPVLEPALRARLRPDLTM